MCVDRDVGTVATAAVAGSTRAADGRGSAHDPRRGIETTIMYARSQYITPSATMGPANGVSSFTWVGRHRRHPMFLP